MGLLRTSPLALSLEQFDVHRSSRGQSYCSITSCLVLLPAQYGIHDWTQLVWGRRNVLVSDRGKLKLGFSPFQTGGFRLSHTLVCGLAVSSSRHGTDETRLRMEQNSWSVLVLAVSKVLSG